MSKLKRTKMLKGKNSNLKVVTYYGIEFLGAIGCAVCKDLIEKPNEKCLWYQDHHWKDGLDFIVCIKCSREARSKKRQIAKHLGGQ